MPQILITKAQARRFIIARQSYRAFSSPFAGKEGVYEVVRHLGAVQVDPICAFSRNHDHVFFSRVGGYSPAMLEDVLYTSRLCFEYFCNALCVLPMTEYPYFAHRMRREQALYQMLPEVATAAQQILVKLKNEGAFLTREMLSGLRAAGWWDGGEATSKIEKVALDILHYTGQVMVQSRHLGQRRYDLPERIVPVTLLRQEVSEGEWQEFMMHKFLRSFGLSQTNLPRFGWSTAPKRQVKDLLRSFIERKLAVEISIEGVTRKYYCHADHLGTLLADAPLPKTNEVVFVAPLDNLAWDRDRLLDLFSFQYRWEVYTPKARRIYGYYVLPILCGESMVGRIELKALRAEGVLEVVNLWLHDNHIEVKDAVRVTAVAIAQHLGLKVKGM